MKSHTHTLINRIRTLLKQRYAGAGYRAGYGLPTLLLCVCMLCTVLTTNSQARDVTVLWDASTDTTITGYKLYYNADSASAPFSGTGASQGASPYDVKKVTTATLTGLDPAHAYYFAVTAYNAAGTESPYSNIVSVPEASPPTVSITSPAPNSAISGTVSVTATATDNVGVSKVEFYLNGILAITDTSTPYLYSLNSASLATGANTLQAKAYDAAGNIGLSGTISVTVVNDTIAPTVSLTSPVANAIVSGTTVITASASDNVGVSKVEFYANGTLLYVTNVSPFSYGWNTATVTNGSYILTSRAYDNTGNVGLSANYPVTVNNPVADTTAPTVSVTAPVNSATVSGIVTVVASATDNVGVSRVEFSVNGALKATATSAPYSYSWDTASAANGSYTVSAAAYDAAGNKGQSVAISVTVSNPVLSSSSLWADTVVPGVIDSGPDSAVELGVKFRSDTAGSITGIRFYKASTNTGTHVGNLWDNTGKLISTATFSGETASGWQTVKFSTPAAIAANTVYVASYHTNTGHYSADLNYFTGKGVDSPPLHALADGTSGYSGAYAYGSTSSFPSMGWKSSNYWVDVTFTPSGSVPADATAPVVAVSSPASGTTVSGTVTVTTTASDTVGVSKVEFYVNSQLQGADTAAPYSFSWNTAALTNGSYSLTARAYDAAGNVGQSSAVTVTVNNVVADTTIPAVSVTAPLTGATVSGTVSVTAAASDNVAVSRVEFYLNGVLQTSDSTSPYSFSWNTASAADGACNLIAKAFDAAGNSATSSTITVTVANAVVTPTKYSFWPATTVPSVVDSGPDSAVELGVKFRSDVKGTISGIRFYKASTNTGTHVANLWSSAGKLLATATFAGETASGWQQVSFATPVAIAASTVYVASYHTNVGHYSDTQSYFASKGVDNGPLHALANGVSGTNSVYAYGTASKFPTQSYLSTNYWVDVVFNP